MTDRHILNDVPQNNDVKRPWHRVTRGAPMWQQTRHEVPKREHLVQVIKVALSIFFGNMRRDVTKIGLRAVDGRHYKLPTTVARGHISDGRYIQLPKQGFHVGNGLIRPLYCASRAAQYVRRLRGSPHG